MDISIPFTAADFVEVTQNVGMYRETQCGKPIPVEVDDLDSFAKYSFDLMLRS